ncbi:MAG: nucleotidyltransferase domain-containing protein [Candidatus Aenigmarchaeota archaeon]|nr:nucleotidyltransferase domain-containing protein [Candidatus Aenigmarchaeota archaeon]
MVQKRNNIQYEILLHLLKGENHLRGIAKSLGQSHTTILRKLNFLAEEKVLDYRIQGKNKIFFIKNSLQAKSYVFNAENYKMIKLVRKYPKLSVIIEEILMKTNKELIILFGSYAKFSAQKDSDIDIYVETTDKKVKENLEYIHSKIKVKIGEFDKKSMLIKEIIKGHIIVRGMERFYEKIKFFE